MLDSNVMLLHHDLVRAERDGNAEDGRVEIGRMPATLDDRYTAVRVSFPHSMWSRLFNN